MKRLVSVLALSALAAGAFAQSEHYVNPYYRSDGTYVQGHHQTNPDSSRTNNWSSQGNTNPYTGQAGTVNPYEQQQRQPSHEQRGLMQPTPQEQPQSIWPQRRY